MIQKYFGTWAAGLLVLCLAGCGESGPEVPGLDPVTGTVTMGGKPVAGAVVTFIPEKGSYSVGRTDEAGKFTLKYAGTHPGAVAGKNLVRISKMNDEAGIETLPRKYNEGSKLTQEVKKGEPNDFTFEL